jgi:hypothetical protein
LPARRAAINRPLPTATTVVAFALASGVVIAALDAAIEDRGQPRISQRSWRRLLLTHD